MLWYKAWLETRTRLLLAFCIVAFMLVSLYSAGLKPQNFAAAVSVNAAVFATMFSGMLASAGIVTQPAFQASKGIHGSTLFTLSLPVSRSRLLAVRAGLGWLEMAGGVAIVSCAIWIMFPQVRESGTAADIFRNGAALVCCASAFYAISVFLGAFLDDLWRTWGTLLTFAVLWILPTQVRVPDFANIVRGMAGASPMVTHTMPWATMAFSLGAAAVMIAAAVKVAQAKEY